MIIDQSPLHPDVRDVMLDQGLPIKQVLQNGPRYAVVSTELDGVYSVFKMVIPGAVNVSPYQVVDPELTIPLHNVILKEIRLLELLDMHQSDFAGMTPHLFRYSTDADQTWYLRELFRGKPQGDSRIPFRYKPEFYEQITPDMMTGYFFSLHNLTSLVSPELNELFQMRYPVETHVRQLVEALDGEYNHPLVRRHQKEVGEFLTETMKNIADDRNVITHREPYGVHTFVQEGRIGLIDWERSSLGHPLYDVALIWIRTFDNIKWREALVESLTSAGYLSPERQRAWDMLVLINAIASYNHFQFNRMPDPDYHDRAVKSLAGIMEDIIKRVV